MDQINSALEEYNEEVVYRLSSINKCTLPEAQEISATHEDILIKGFNGKIDPHLVALDMHYADAELKNCLRK